MSLLYFYLPDAAMCLRRVAARVAAGGHHIPPEVVRRRYQLSLRYLFELYQPAVTEWSICDNELQTPQPIASAQQIYNPELWQHLKQQSSLG